MNQTHNLSTGSDTVWIHPPTWPTLTWLRSVYTGAFTPKLSSWAAKERGSLEKKPLVNHLSHLASIEASPPLYKASWSSSSQTSLRTPSPSVTSVTWPRPNEVLKRFPWVGLTSCALPPLRDHRCWSPLFPDQHHLRLPDIWLWTVWLLKTLCSSEKLGTPDTYYRLWFISATSSSVIDPEKHHLVTKHALKI